MDDVSRKLIASLIEINQWEASSLPLADSVVGRHVYFCIINELLTRDSIANDRSLKQVLAHPSFTDRAIRMKLRDMEQQGLLNMSKSESDKRSRFIEPTDELIKIFQNHSEEFSKIIKRNLFILSKNND